MSGGRLKIVNLALEDSGMYQCVAENKHGNVYSNGELRVQGGDPALEVPHTHTSDGSFATESVRRNDSLTRTNRPDSAFEFSPLAERNLVVMLCVS